MGPTSPVSVVVRVVNSLIVGHRGLHHREGMESLGRRNSFPANPGPFGPVVAGPSDGSRPRNPCQIDPLPQIEPEVDGLSTRILDDSSMNMADLERPSFCGATPWGSGSRTA